MLKINKNTTTNLQASIINILQHDWIILHHINQSSTSQAEKNAEHHNTVRYDTKKTGDFAKANLVKKEVKLEKCQ